MYLLYQYIRCRSEKITSLVAKSQFHKNYYGSTSLNNTKQYLRVMPTQLYSFTFKVRLAGARPAICEGASLRWRVMGSKFSYISSNPSLYVLNILFSQ